MDFAAKWLSWLSWISLEKKNKNYHYQWEREWRHQQYGFAPQTGPTEPFGIKTNNYNILRWLSL
jgi:hypothetical protein